MQRNEYGYIYTPDPLLTRRQKVQRFFQRRKPLFWTLVGVFGYIAITALIQTLDAQALRSLG
jgi:hypothetical protein